MATSWKSISTASAGLCVTRYRWRGKRMCLSRLSLSYNLYSPVDSGPVCEVAHGTTLHSSLSAHHVAGVRHAGDSAIEHRRCPQPHSTYPVGSVHGSALWAMEVSSGRLAHRPSD